MKFNGPGGRGQSIGNLNEQLLWGATANAMNGSN